MNVAIVGGGIVGLALALGLKDRGIACDVYEAVPSVREIGVGITLLPHGMRELAALGLQPAIEAAGLEARYSAFFNRFGQLIYKDSIEATVARFPDEASLEDIYARVDAGDGATAGVRR